MKPQTSTYKGMSLKESAISHGLTVEQANLALERAGKEPQEAWELKRIVSESEKFSWRESTESYYVKASNGIPVRVEESAICETLSLYCNIFRDGAVTHKQVLEYIRKHNLVSEFSLSKRQELYGNR